MKQIENSTIVVPKRYILLFWYIHFHDEESISAKLRELRNKETKFKINRGKTQNERRISN